MNTYTREEQFWAAMAGEQEAPEPVTRIEQLQKKVAEKISEGGGGGGDTPKTINKHIWLAGYSGTVNPGGYYAGATQVQENLKIRNVYGSIIDTSGWSQEGRIQLSTGAVCTSIVTERYPSGYAKMISSVVYNGSSIALNSPLSICCDVECDA